MLRQKECGDVLGVTQEKALWHGKESPTNRSQALSLGRAPHIEQLCCCPRDLDAPSHSQANKVKQL